MVKIFGAWFCLTNELLERISFSHKDFGILS